MSTAKLKGQRDVCVLESNNPSDFDCQFLLRSSLRIRTPHILFWPSLSWGLHSLPHLPFLKTLVYHPTTLDSLAQPHIHHLISLVFVSILSSFLWFLSQMRRRVRFPTDSNHHDCFPSAAVFHQTRRPVGQMLISNQNHFFLSTQNTTFVDERWVVE